MDELIAHAATIRRDPAPQGNTFDHRWSNPLQHHGAVSRQAFSLTESLSAKVPRFWQHNRSGHHQLVDGDTGHRAGGKLRIQNLEVAGYPG